MRDIDRARETLLHPRATLVVDIDGTLADDRHRAHLRPSTDPHCLRDAPIDAIERYMDPGLVRLDEPITGAARFLAAFNRDVVLVTARWDRLRRTTEHWLEKHFPKLEYRYLLMRREQDARVPSVNLKLHLVTMRASFGGVWLDDDPLMLETAGRAGFVTLKAPEIYEVAR